MRGSGVLESVCEDEAQTVVSGPDGGGGPDRGGVLVVAAAGNDNDGWQDLFVSGYRWFKSTRAVAADYLGMEAEGTRPILWEGGWVVLRGACWGAGGGIAKRQRKVRPS